MSNDGKSDDKTGNSTDGPISSSKISISIKELEAKFANSNLPASPLKNQGSQPDDLDSSHYEFDGDPDRSILLAGAGGDGCGTDGAGSCGDSGDAGGDAGCGK